MAVNSTGKNRGLRWVKIGSGMHSAAASALLLALVVMVNFLSFRHYRRWDISGSRLYSPSARSVQVVEDLTQAVDMVLFMQSEHPLTPLLERLAESYAQHSPLLRIRRVDPDRDLAESELLVKEYGLRDQNVVVFSAGKDRTVAVPADRMAQIDYEPVEQGQRPRVEMFAGEQHFTSALLTVTKSRRPVALFLQGHGERNPENYDRKKGYSDMAERMRLDHIEVRTAYPEDRVDYASACDLLIVAGPRTSCAERERAAIREFLDRDGRILLLLDAGQGAGFEDLLESWGAQFRPHAVVDPARTISGRELIVRQYGTHAVTRGLEGLTTVFYLPAAIMPLARDAAADSEADRPQTTVLARSSAKGWGEFDPENEPVKFDASVDLPGPVPVALAIQGGRLGGPEAGIRPARMVVIGDSDFASNQSLAGANAHLFMNAVNWLLDRNRLIPAEPRSIHTARLQLSRNQLVSLGWLVIVCLPAAAAAVGFAVWMKRRK